VELAELLRLTPRQVVYSMQGVRVWLKQNNQDLAALPCVGFVVPVAALMEEGSSVMKPDGMMVFFAGVPNGTMGAVNLSNVYLSNAQYTGTSGLTIDDQASVMQRRVAGTLSLGRSVAAIGGLETAAEAIESVIEGKYPGKVVIFPQIRNLPLMGLKELKERLPEVAAKLGEDLMWTNEAEVALIEKMWEKP
jgi:D-arabinose 1-dehydrogenase-like Zn-dependent alcohol dehydrogenase